MLVLLQMSSNWLIKSTRWSLFTYDLNAEFILLPQDKLSPYILEEVDLEWIEFENLHAKVQYGQVSNIWPQQM
jgi:hypothetical protein